MKKQNVLVCDDLQVGDFNKAIKDGEKLGLKGVFLNAYASEMVNFSGELCKELRKKGHNVTLFNGRDRRDCKTEIRNVNSLANEIGTLIMQKAVTCMVFDLNYFSDFNMGIRILKKLRSDQSIPEYLDKKILIWSRYTNEPDYNYQEVLTKELRILEANILDRNHVDIYEIAEIIQEWS